MGYHHDLVANIVPPLSWFQSLRSGPQGVDPEGGPRSAEHVVQGSDHLLVVRGWDLITPSRLERIRWVASRCLLSQVVSVVGSGSNEGSNESWICFSVVICSEEGLGGMAGTVNV